MYEYRKGLEILTVPLNLEADREHMLVFGTEKRENRKGHLNVSISHSAVCPSDSESSTVLVENH